MPTFKVFHPFGKVINHNLDRGLYEYEPICTVVCENIKKAFKSTQADLNEEYARLTFRSTCIGDIIVDGEDNHFFVTNKGFTPIPSTVTYFIDWGNYIEIKS